MKKIIFILFFAGIVSGTAIFAETKIGLLGGYPTYLTFSVDNIDIQIGSAFLGLSVAADFKVYKQDLTMGSTSGLFWNIGIGPYLDLGIGWFGVGLLVPFEFGYNIPQILEDRLDVYVQIAPGVRLLSGSGFSPGFAYNAGLGVRYKL